MARFIFLLLSCFCLVNGMPLKARMDQLEEKIKHLEEIILEKESLVSVAFSTRLHEDTTINDGPVVFGTVDLNIGDGYDEFTGVFTPPVTGVYLLTLYAMTNIGDAGNIYMKRNENVLCYAFITDGSNGYDTATCSTIVELTEGDSVRVTGNSDNPAVINGDFSGFLGHIIKS